MPKRANQLLIFAMFAKSSLTLTRFVKASTFLLTPECPEIGMWLFLAEFPTFTVCGCAHDNTQCCSGCSKTFTQMISHCISLSVFFYPALCFKDPCMLPSVHQSVASHYYIICHGLYHILRIHSPKDATQILPIPSAILRHTALPCPS